MRELADQRPARLPSIRRLALAALGAITLLVGPAEALATSEPPESTSTSVPTETSEPVASSETPPDESSLPPVTDPPESSQPADGSTSTSTSTTSTSPTTTTTSSSTTSTTTTEVPVSEPAVQFAVPMVATLAAAADPPATCWTSWPVRLNDVGYPARCVETRLRQLGYWLSGPDDRFDSTAVTAIRAYQTREGLAVTGWGDFDTLVRLGVWRSTGFPAATCGVHFAVRSGTTGRNATCVERRLTQLGYSLSGPDDLFDATAVRALRSFQYRNGLYADGIAGKNTLSRLGIYDPVPTSYDPPATCKTSWPVYLGDAGYPARCVQTRLAQIGYWLVGPDDDFDATAVNALRAYQRREGLSVTGWADYPTLVRMGVWSTTGFPGASCKVHYAVRPGATGAGALCVEGRLAQLGYSLGTPDSTFDSTAVRALRSFQYRNGLYADGIAGAHTLSRLGIYDPNPPPATALPDNSGTGRRIVYSRAQQRIWAVNADGTVAKTHRVSGRRWEPYGGTYYVYSRSLHTYSANDPSVRWRYMIRFAYGPQGGRIGFHEIPNRYGVPLQTSEQLGLPLSGGCVRQSTSDAAWLWNWAPVGTKVVVL